MYNLFQQKTNALTQILASLNLTADLTVLSNTNLSIENVQVTSSNENATSYRETIHETVAFRISPECNVARAVQNNEKLDTSSVSRSQDLQEHRAAKKVKTDVKAEDDEEIDVERVDDVDPMWRPW